MRGWKQTSLYMKCQFHPLKALKAYLLNGPSKLTEVPCSAEFFIRFVYPQVKLTCKVFYYLGQNNVALPFSSFHGILGPVD